LITIVLMTVSGVPVPSGLYMQLVGIGLIAWPVSWAASWGSILRILYASRHQTESESLSRVGGWFYGVLFSLPHLETGLVMVMSISLEVALLFSVFAVVVSTFVFGTLLVVFWRKKLYIYGYYASARKSGWKPGLWYQACVTRGID
jgi:hypothetical protein